MDGDYIDVVSNGTEWKVISGYSHIDIGWQNCSDWTNRTLGNGVTYNNKSAAVDLTGEKITEETSGFTAIVLFDSGGTGSSGILYIYNLSSGFTFWTNDRELTAGGGTTCDVDEGTGSSKNQNYNFYHGFGEYLQNINKKIIYSEDSTEGSVFIPDLILRGGGDVSDDYGVTYFGVDINSFTQQTGQDGIAYIGDDGDTTILDNEDWYYNILLEFIG
jgi:hypothetical protein